MTDNIRVIFVDLPCSIRGFTKKRLENYTIVLNSRLSKEANEKTLKHEVDHIKNGDLDREADIQELEYIAHGL